MPVYSKILLEAELWQHGHALYHKRSPIHHVAGSILMYSSSVVKEPVAEEYMRPVFYRSHDIIALHALIIGIQGQKLEQA